MLREGFHLKAQFESSLCTQALLLWDILQLSLVMRKSAFCICENKDAEQLRGNHEADQRLCFRYIDSTIPLLLKYEISSFLPSCVVVQPNLCRTWSDTPKTNFLTTRLNCCACADQGFRSGLVPSPTDRRAFGVCTLDDQSGRMLGSCGPSLCAHAALLVVS